MKKNMDKFKRTIALNKKIVIFLIGLSLIGILFGAFYTVLLQDTDKTLVKDYMTEFLTSVSQKKVGNMHTYINSSLSTSIFLVAVWILGISIIGVPIMLFMYFSKTFVMGFSIASFILQLKAKGCLVAFLYFVPHTILIFGFYILLLNYAITLSFKLAESFFKKKSIDFKVILYRYSMILGVCIVGCLILNLYEAFVLPKVLSSVLAFIK